MSTNKIYCTLRVERDLSPWWNNRWEFDKKTKAPVIKTVEGCDFNETLTPDELVLLVYLYFTKREITELSTTSLYEMAHLFGYKAVKNDTRTARKLQTIIEGVMSKCAPAKGKSIEVEGWLPSKGGWEKQLFFKVTPVSLRELKKKRGVAPTYLQLNNQEFIKILNASLGSKEPFYKLLTVYMYMKTFFGTSKIQEDLYGWGGWRNSRLASLDLHMDHKRFVKLRAVLVDHHVLFRHKQNPSLFATDNEANIWTDVVKRWPHRLIKNKLKMKRGEAIDDDQEGYTEDEIEYGNTDADINIEATIEAGMAEDQLGGTIFSAEDLEAIKNFNF